MKIDITKDQYDDFLNLQTSRVKDLPVNFPGRSTQPVSNIKQKSKIYVFPTTKIKKLPLRKWMKANGHKVVFKPEEADVLVVPANLNGSSDRTINLISGYIVPAGTYYYNVSNTPMYDCDVDYFNNLENCRRLYYNMNVYPSDNSGLYIWGIKKSVADKWLDDNWKHEYRLDCNETMNESHLFALVDKTKMLVNDLDIQQVLYDWEVKEKVRENNEEYNWEGIESLLLSDDRDNGMIALQIIERIEIEPILYKLGVIYLSYKLCDELRKYMYDRIFFRSPDFRNSLPTPKPSARRWRDNIATCTGTYIRYHQNNNKEYDLTYFNKIGYNVHIDHNGSVTLYEYRAPKT